MKKFIALLLTMILAMTALCACSASDNANDTTSADTTSADTTAKVDQNTEKKAYKIGIIQYMPHPSLDNCTTGIKEALTASGLNVTIDVQTGASSSADSDCSTYAKSMAAQKYDMIFAVATPAAISAYAATEGTNIPVIFCAVSDPVVANIVKSLDNPGDLCTGTSDVLDLSAQLDMIQSFQPDVKKIGILYTQSEANSITQLALFKAEAEKRNIEVVDSGVANASDIPSAAAALCGQVECINNFTDNNVVLNLNVLLDAANSANIPVYGSEIEQVKNGCLASMSIDYVALGKVTGQMGVDVLNGADAKTMAVKTISEATAVVNSDVLASFSYQLPEKFANAEMVTSAK